MSYSQEDFKNKNQELKLWIAFSHDIDLFYLMYSQKLVKWNIDRETSLAMVHFNKWRWCWEDVSDVKVMGTMIFLKLVVNVLVKLFCLYSAAILRFNHCHNVDVSIWKVKLGCEWSKGENLGLRVQSYDDLFNVCEYFHSYLMLFSRRSDVKIEWSNFLMKTNQWILNRFYLGVHPW